MVLPQKRKKQSLPSDIAAMKATAALVPPTATPIRVNMEFYEYPDGSGYETLYQMWYNLVPMKSK